MDRKVIESYLGKRVKLVCKDGFLYHGKILNVLDTSFQIKDRFSENVWINISNVDRIQDERGE